MVLTLVGCSYDEGMETYDVAVQLTVPDGMSASDLSGLTVTMTDTKSVSFQAETDAEATARFSLPAGIYNASVSAADGQLIVNGNLPQVVVGNGGITTGMTLAMSVVVVNRDASGLIIKEIYNGGCQKDDGSGAYYNDKCIVLYNNSGVETQVDNLCIGIIEPYNAESSNHGFLNAGVLDYASQDWIPAINGIWYFQGTLTVPAYTEVVVAVNGAIDNTRTYSNSINYANPDYYVMYDPEAASSDGGHYNNVTYYPAPSEVIPSSHYLKAVKYGKGNAWAISNVSPAVILFQVKDSTPAVWGNDIDNIIYPPQSQGNIVYACLRVPRSWVLDGVEVYNNNKLSDCKKRITPDIDNGYVSLTNAHGHALMRHIDAAATAKAGHYVYIDTNNSSNDFYEADRCSLRK